MNQHDKLDELVNSWIIIDVKDAQWLKEAKMKDRVRAKAAITKLIEDIIGEDSPLDPPSSATGQLGVDPVRWREWSIVENHLREQQRAKLKEAQQ